MWPMLDGANIEHFVLGREGAVDKTVCPLDSPVVFFFSIYLFIYLAAPGLSCGMQPLLVAACGFLVAACGI